MLRIIGLASLLAVSTSNVAASQGFLAPELQYGKPIASRALHPGAVISGDVALAGLWSSRQAKMAQKSNADTPERGNLNPCKRTSRWECMLGGAGIGLLAGALIGHALAPAPHDYVDCGTFFGCLNKCDAHCFDQGDWALRFGLGGAIIGAVTGFYLTREPTS